MLFACGFFGTALSLLSLLGVYAAVMVYVVDRKTWLG